jgi:hypothetical protein
MPRIAVAVGVVALIAFSIGFNTTRYPLVWEMVGGPLQQGQPSQPQSSAVPPQPTTVAQDIAAAGTSTEMDQGGNAYTDTSGSAADHPPQPVSSSVEGPPGVDAAEPTTSTVLAPQLARVEPPDLRKDTALGMDSGGEIRRLPPVDQVAPSPADRRLERSPQDPISIYPGTGT